MTTIDGIPIDVVISERVTEQAVTTEHPVEQGSEPTDHVRVLPIRLTLECLISNTPILESDRLSRGLAQGTPIEKIDYARRTYEQIRALRNGRAIVVQTAARRFENMQITELAQVRDSSLGRTAIQFTVQFKEIFLVSTGSVQLERVTVTAIPQKPTATLKQGKQTEEAGGTHGEHYRGSILKGITDDGVFGLFEEGSITTFGSGFRPRN